MCRPCFSAREKFAPEFGRDPGGSAGVYAARADGQEADQNSMRGRCGGGWVRGQEGTARQSSLTMVTVPCVFSRTAPTGFVRFTKNVSSGSSAASPFTVTWMTWGTLKEVKLRVPEVAT